jgi:hypothetical protein
MQPRDFKTRVRRSGYEPRTARIQPVRHSHARVHSADTHRRAPRVQVALFVLCVLCGVAMFWTGVR